MRVVRLAVVSTLALVAQRAAADPIRLRPGFAPQPLVTEEIKVRVDSDAHVGDRWPTCASGGGGYTTKAPTLTFDLEAAMDLRVRLDARNPLDPALAGAVIVFPDGTYLCESEFHDFADPSWPKGHYELYLTGISFEVSATIRFEQPARSVAARTAAMKAMPHVELGAAGVLNPRYQAVPATVVVDAVDAGKTCAKRRERVMPLAWIDVSRAAPWFIASGDQDLFVLTEDGACIDPDRGGDLPVGHHQLWARVKPGTTPPSTLELELDDRGGALVVAPAETREVGPVEQPLVIGGTVRPAERWSSRRDACRGAARAPDFYLHSDRPLQHVTLSLLWSHAAEQLHLYGPLERATDTRLRCGDDDDAHEVDLFEGTYAVWIGGAQVGSPYHLLVNRAGVVIDPMTALAPVPDTLTIPDRAITHHYPYFKGDGLPAWTALFTTAPERLFVYPRAPITADRVTVPEGEPLLVSSANDRQVYATRFDGSSVTLDARLITDVKPATVALPTTITVPEADTVSRAQDLAGPEDQKALAAFHALDNQFSSCMGDYLAAHDPTWGHNAEVYRISGNNVVNVSDQVAKAGERHCGGSRLEAAQTSLLKNLAKSRTARWKAHLAAVRKRFGV
ncbi:MAG: hypothetical protein K8W52_01250 [Deltaproteobacteria bacterium]|nr:hypothetical protein [Deltaproteobacteria bacterium]